MRVMAMPTTTTRCAAQLCRGRGARGVWQRCSALLAVMAMSAMVATLLLAPTGAAGADCPRQCECKWKSGKESVLCLQANLSALPAHLDAPGTQILDLTGNEFAAIAADLFTAANLLNLQKLYLAKCRIRRVDRFAFRKIKNLVELDLSYNQLGAVPTHAFDSTPELRELRLSGNPIDAIAAEAFAQLPQLVRLELADCRIARIETHAFAGLEQSLEWLRLDRNRLLSVPEAEGTFTVLRQLHGLELAGNGWNCSCALRPLRRWMLRENIPYGVPPVCAWPDRLAARTWDRLELDEFACGPQIVEQRQRRLVPTVVHATEGDNATLQCAWTAAPEPQVLWVRGGGGGGGGEQLPQRLTANLSAETPVSTVQMSRRLYVAHWWPASSNLTLVHVERHDAGVYRCSAENRAGAAEWTVRLVVHARPPAALLEVRNVLTALVAALAMLALCTVCGVCGCSAWRGGSGGRGAGGRLWKKRRRRTESCENIEMTFQADKCGGADGQQLQQQRLREAHVASAGGGGAGATRPYGENGIAVVGYILGATGEQTAAMHGRHQYRSVPSHDVDDEEHAESVAAATSLTNSDAAKATSQFAVGDRTMGSHLKALPEVHCSSRLIDFRDQLPGCNADTSLLDGCPFDANKSAYSSPARPPPTLALYTKPTWTQSQQTKHLHHPLASGQRKSEVYTSASLDRQHAHAQPPPGIAAANGAMMDNSKYPDLLDITNLNQRATASAPNTEQLVLSTYPRQRASPARTADTQQLGHLAQRLIGTPPHQLPIVSASNANLRTTQSPLRSSSHANANHQHHHHRSNSINIVQALAVNDAGGQPDDNHQHTQRMRAGLNNNPALASASTSASSPTPPPTNSPPNNAGTGSYANGVRATGGGAHTYDYHAAQLERFLEEYRNLQQQLCRMKETCDSIRLKEQPHSQRQQPTPAPTTSTLQSDAAMLHQLQQLQRRKAKVSNALSGGGGGAPRQPPDPPPYWLHRSAALHRLQESSSTSADANAGGLHCDDPNVADNGNNI